MKQKILVIAAHPDDETLGCGGTISKFTKENYEARVIFLSDGVLENVLVARHILHRPLLLGAVAISITQ